MTFAHFAKSSLVGCLCLILLPAACTIVVAPPPEAVLEGVWALATTMDFGFDQRSMTFDGTGHLTQVQTVIGRTTYTSRDLHQSTSVDGNHVRIETTDDYVYEGNFNADQTVITGNLKTESTFFDTTVTTDQGGFTLTKQ